jgi:hypothetical protein
MGDSLTNPFGSNDLPFANPVDKYAADSPEPVDSYR